MLTLIGEMGRYGSDCYYYYNTICLPWSIIPALLWSFWYAACRPIRPLDHEILVLRCVVLAVLRSIYCRKCCSSCPLRLSCREFCSSCHLESLLYGVWFQLSLGVFIVRSVLLAVLWSLHCRECCSSCLLEYLL